MHTRRSSSSIALSGSGGFDENNKAGPAVNAEHNLVDHSRITMKTRVAVRDHTPHRFQVVPLRDVGQLVVSRKESSSQLVLPSTPSSGILKCPSGKLNTGQCLQDYPTMSSLPSFHSIHAALNVNQLPKDRYITTKATVSKDVFKVSTPNRRREKDRIQSVGDTRPVLVEVDLNANSNRRTVKSDNISHFSLRNNRRFVTIQQHLPCKPDPYRMSVDSLELGTVNSLKEAENDRVTEDQQCLADDCLSVSHIDIEERNSKFNSRSNFVKKVTFDLKHEGSRQSVDSELDEPRSKKRHAIYTQSLLVPYFRDMESPNKPSVDNSAASENIGSIERNPDAQDATFPTQEDLEVPCNPLKNGDWLAFLDESSEMECVDVGGKRLLGEGFELKPSTTTVAPLNYVLRLVDEHTTGREKKDVSYPRIVMELFADIDKAIQGWQSI